MGRNRAFPGPPPADRLRRWWYAKTRAARVRSLLVVAAALGVVAFAAGSNRDASRPGTGIASATGPRPTLAVVAPPPSLEIGTTTLPAEAAPTSTTPVQTTSTTARPRQTATSRGVTTAATTTTVVMWFPVIPPDPGVIFNDPPPTAPTTTSAPTTTVAPTTTTTAAVAQGAGLLQAPLGLSPLLGG